MQRSATVLHSITQLLMVGQVMSLLESAHYAEVLKHDLENHVVQSRATVTLIVRTLSKMNLIQRKVIDSRPIRTVYEPTEKGLKLLKYLQEIENLSIE